MKNLTLGLLAAASLFSAADAAPAGTKLTAPIHQFIDNFDKGDQKAAAAAFATGGLTIIDEVPPHIWTGSDALQTWANDLVANDKGQGITSEKVTLGKATRVVESGDHGYVVIPVVYTYKQHKTAMREPAQMTFALQKSGDAWLISGWTWVGTKPQAATAKAAAPAPTPAPAAAPAPAKPK